MVFRIRLKSRIDRRALSSLNVSIQVKRADGVGSEVEREKMLFCENTLASDGCELFRIGLKICFDRG